MARKKFKKNKNRCCYQQQNGLKPLLLLLKEK